MEEKANWFIQLYNAFKESPLRFMSFSLLVIGLVFLYEQQKLIADLIPPSVEAQSAYFEKSIERDYIINSALDVLIDDYSATSATVVQYHNGKHDLTNVPFLYASTTYIAGDIPEGFNVYQDTQLSLMSNFNSALWKPQPNCTYFYTNDLKDVVLKRRYKQFKFETLVACPVVNNAEYPIGYIMAGYSQRLTERQANSIITHLRSVASLMGGYLKPY